MPNSTNSSGPVYLFPSMGTARGPRINPCINTSMPTPRGQMALSTNTISVSVLFRTPLPNALTISQYDENYFPAYVEVQGVNLDAETAQLGIDFTSEIHKVFRPGLRSNTSLSQLERLTKGL